MSTQCGFVTFLVYNTCRICTEFPQLMLFEAGILTSTKLLFQFFDGIVQKSNFLILFFFNVLQLLQKLKQVLLAFKLNLNAIKTTLRNAVHIQQKYHCHLCPACSIGIL